MFLSSFLNKSLAMLKEFTIDAHLNPRGRIVFPVWASNEMEAHMLAHGNLVAMMQLSGEKVRSIAVTATPATIPSREIKALVDTGMVEIEEGEH